MRGEALDCGDQVGDQVSTTLQDYVHLGPFGFDIFIEADHFVAAAGVHTAEDEREDEENGDDGESCFHGLPPGSVLGGAIILQERRLCSGSRSVGESQKILYRGDGGKAEGNLRKRRDRTYH